MRTPDTQVLAELYQGVADNGILHGAIERLARRFDCETATIVMIDPLEPLATAKLGVGAFNTQSCAQYNAEYAALNPAPAAMARLPSGSVIASDQFFSSDFRRRHVFVQDFMLPIGVEESLVGKMMGEGGRVSFLSVHRGKGRRAFDDDDVAGLAAYLPYIDQALSLRRAFVRMQTGFDLLGETIDRLAVGVGVYGPDGVIHVNRALRAIAARCDGIAIDRGGAVRARDAYVNGLLSRAQRDVATGGHGGRVMVPRQQGELPYAVMVAPLFGGSLSNPSGPSTIVLVNDPDAIALDEPDAIIAACGLPPGTSRLVAAMLKGESAVEYGERTGVSHATVRHHLKVAFARTGARSQAQLIQRVMRTLGDFRRLRPPKS